MHERVTCIAGLWLRMNEGYVEVLIEQAGRWVVVMREEASSLRNHTMNALAIDKAVNAALRSWEGRE